MNLLLWNHQCCPWNVRWNVNMMGCIHGNLNSDSFSFPLPNLVFISISRNIFHGIAERICQATISKICDLLVIFHKENSWVSGNYFWTPWMLYEEKKNPNVLKIIINQEFFPYQFLMVWFRTGPYFVVIWSIFGCVSKIWREIMS